MADSCKKIAFFCFLVTLLMMIIVVDAVGFTIGIQHQNASCYSEAYTMSLSSWLISTNIFTFVSIVCMINVMYCKGINNIILKDFVPFACLISVPLVVSIAMTVIGCAELGYQFTSCINDIKPVIIATILVICTNVFTYITIFQAIIFSFIRPGYIGIF